MTMLRQPPKFSAGHKIHIRSCYFNRPSYGGPEGEDGDGTTIEGHHGTRRLSLRLRRREGNLHPGREGFFSSTAEEPPGRWKAAARPAGPLRGPFGRLPHRPAKCPGFFRQHPLPRPAVASHLGPGPGQDLRRHPPTRDFNGGHRSPPVLIFLRTVAQADTLRYNARRSIH